MRSGGPLCGLSIQARRMASVEGAYLGKLVGDGVALLHQPAFVTPVPQEAPAEPVACLLEKHRAGAVVWFLVRRSRGIFLPVLEGAQLAEKDIKRRLVLRVIL